MIPAVSEVIAVGQLTHAERRQVSQRDQLAGDRLLEHRPGRRERERAGPQCMEVIAVPAERGLDRHVQPVGCQLAGQAQPPPHPEVAHGYLRHEARFRMTVRRGDQVGIVVAVVIEFLAGQPGQCRADLAQAGWCPPAFALAGEDPEGGGEQREHAHRAARALCIDVAQAPASLACSQLCLVQGAAVSAVAASVNSGPSRRCWRLNPLSAADGNPLVHGRVGLGLALPVVGVEMGDRHARTFNDRRDVTA